MTAIDPRPASKNKDYSWLLVRNRKQLNSRRPAGTKQHQQPALDPAFYFPESNLVRQQEIRKIMHAY